MNRYEAAPFVNSVLSDKFESEMKALAEAVKPCLTNPDHQIDIDEFPVIAKIRSATQFGPYDYLLNGALSIADGSNTLKNIVKNARKYYDLDYMMQWDAPVES